MSARPDPLVIRCLRGLGTSGVAAIEFAFAAPLVVMLMMMMLELGYLLTGGILLETGARAAARYALTGQQQKDETREAAIRRIVTSYVCPKGAGGYCFWSSATKVDSADGQTSPLTISSQVFTDPGKPVVPEPFSDTNPQNGRYDSGEAYTDVNGNGRWDAHSGAGSAGDFVIYEVRMAQDVLNPLFRWAMAGGILWHDARIAVRNEAF